MATVIVADDNDDILFMVSTIVRKLGHEVVAVPDGGQALEFCLTQPWDLAILDITMPEASGLDVVRAVRARVEGGGGPILILSALSGAHMDAVVRDTGADGYLAKPIPILELRNAVTALLERGRPAAGASAPGPSDAA